MAKKKPTNKEITQAIMDINNRINHMYNMIRGFDSIFTIYLEQKGDKKALEERLKEIEKEREKANEQKENGKADKPNLQGNTDGESSGAERVRQAGK
tara:strand:- start:3644 stop:3934 length:291 start_codon:yes stop_codon:yes gene_type:complete